MEGSRHGEEAPFHGGIDVSGRRRREGGDGERGPGGIEGRVDSEAVVLGDDLHAEGRRLRTSGDRHGQASTDPVGECGTGAGAGVAIDDGRHQRETDFPSVDEHRPLVEVDDGDESRRSVPCIHHGKSSEEPARGQRAEEPLLQLGVLQGREPGRQINGAEGAGVGSQERFTARGEDGRRCGGKDVDPRGLSPLDVEPTQLPEGRALHFTTLRSHPRRRFQSAVQSRDVQYAEITPKCFTRRLPARCGPTRSPARSEERRDCTHDVILDSIRPSRAPREGRKLDMRRSTAGFSHRLPSG